MNLSEIKVSNYRSIEELTFEFNKVDESSTFTLLGVNESGKSNFLKAIQLVVNENIEYPQDYHDDSKPVVIDLKYKLDFDDIVDLNEHLKSKYQFEKNILKKIKIKDVTISIKFDPEDSPEQTITENIAFEKYLFKEYKFNALLSSLGQKTEEEKSEPDFDLKNFFEVYLCDYFWNISHYITLWRASSEFLITDQIDLSSFAKSPATISVPLSNCFKIAGMEDITQTINKLNNPASIQNLEDALSDKVTKHINKIWPEHPIKIKFNINNNKITFLVEDNKVKYKLKTTSQRSDGFRQFISFLLTISAENQIDELRNSILLLDEPETHLHPTAQILLKNELIKISKNQNNNIVFFATHSNYMIDKDNIDRCYRVSKRKNEKTEIVRIEKCNTSYSEVNYDIFDIATSDYHNELYGYLEAVSPEKLSNLKKDKKWKNVKTAKTEEVSLSKYIRHSIHHPENTSNKKFTDDELKKSIKILKGLKYHDGAP